MRLLHISLEKPIVLCEIPNQTNHHRNVKFLTIYFTEGA